MRDQNFDKTFPGDPLDFIERVAGAGLYVIELATGEVYWSAGMYRLLHVSPDSVKPSRHAIRSMIHPEDIRPLDEMDYLHSSGQPFALQFRIITSDRRPRWVSNTAEFLMDEGGKPEFAVGVIRDIDESQRATQHAADAATRLDTVLQLTDSFAWTSNARGELTRVSNWKAVDLSHENPLGSRLLDLVHPDDVNETRSAFCTSAENGSRFFRQHRMRTASGDYRWRQCSAIPFRSSTGSVVEFVGLSIDIHESKTGKHMIRQDEPVTGAQIRAARSMARLSVRQLSNCCGVSIAKIRRVEDVDGVLNEDTDIGSLLRQEMEKRGIRFLFPPGFKPAVCPK